MVDKDGDGQVSYEEFRKMVHDFNKKASGKWKALLTFPLIVILMRSTPQTSSMFHVFPSTSVLVRPVQCPFLPAV
jgi:hypothetical protein